MLDLTEINGIPLKAAVTDELAVAASNVLRDYCEGFGEDSCNKCIFDSSCLDIWGDSPCEWPELEIRKDKFDWKKNMMNIFCKER